MNEALIWEEIAIFPEDYIYNIRWELSSIGMDSDDQFTLAVCLN